MKRPMVVCVCLESLKPFWCRVNIKLGKHVTEIQSSFVFPLYS